MKLWILFILPFIFAINADLFSGSGLKTIARSILDNKVTEMDCNSYDGCYEVLCDYTMVPIYIVTLEPRKWDGNCTSLNSTDTRMMIADIYRGTDYYNTTTNSDLSILLCNLSKNNTFERIYYFGYNCTA